SRWHHPGGLARRKPASASGERSQNCPVQSRMDLIEMSGTLNRREFLGAGASLGGSPPGRWNVLPVIADQHQAACRPSKDTHALTPNIDASRAQAFTSLPATHRIPSARPAASAFSAGSVATITAITA